MRSACAMFIFVFVFSIFVVYIFFILLFINQYYFIVYVKITKI